MPTDDVPVRPRGLLALEGFALARLGRLVRETIRSALAEQGLTPGTHFVLACLREHGRLSQRELADHLAMDRSDLVKVLDRLERAGHLRRDRDPADRRRHRLAVTDAGLDTLRAGERALRDATDRVLGGLTDAQRAALHQLVLRALDTRH